ncbi:MAG: hypothetical protein NVV59_01560 [Chitinophagaceae bacterium]|nr:hypothetical protein [Chitinophagaceae bacterium]
MELIVKIGTLCITPLLILAATCIFRSKLIRWGAIAINTLFSVLLTLTVLNSPWGWSSQRDLNYKLYAEKEDGYQFVRSNFILLDNSFDKILVPFEDGDVDDSTATVMTNRYALARTMKLLNQHIENVDLVIVDIGFGSPSPATHYYRSR